MAYVAWQGTTGTITTLPQGNAVNVSYSAQFVSNTGATSNVTQYVLQAGSLPPGLTANLRASNTTSNIVTLTGTLSPVAAETTTIFVLRAYANTANTSEYADATYGYTVTRLQPRWTSPANVANILTGNDQSNATSNFYSTISYFEPTVNADVKITLVGGNVPLGMTVDTDAASGVYSNTSVQIPLLNVPLYAPGYADTTSLDASANTFVRPFEFQLNLDDGTFQSNANFAINIYAREFLSADLSTPNALSNTYILTADSDKTQNAWISGAATYFPLDYPPNIYTFPTVPGNSNAAAFGNSFTFDASVSSKYAPWLLTPPGNLGNTVSTDFFATKIQDVNPAGGSVVYTLAARNPDGSPSVLPYGLVLDPVTGYIWGNSLSNTTVRYNFTIAVSDASDSDYVSKSVTYNVLVYSNNPTQVYWTSPLDLGTIENGGTSEFFVAATSPTPDTLYYLLREGSLPPGLILSETGLIIGRVIFDTPAADTTYTFVVEAIGVNTGITGFGTFHITVRHVNARPYNDLYIQSYDNKENRLFIQEITQDYTNIPKEEVYRFEDPNFGIARRLKFLQAINLNPATDSQYNAAMQYNHYWKTVGLSEFRYAQAKNADGTVRYDVVYCEILDDLVNEQTGESVSIAVPLEYPVDYDGTLYTTVYPNSLIDMRRRIYGAIQQVKTDLPLWMASVQADKSVLGFVPAWVVCYANPGKGAGIAFRLNQAYAKNLYTLIFDIDRYELDNRLTYRYVNTGGNTWAWQMPTDLYSNTAMANAISPIVSGNVITATVYTNSLVPEIGKGDTLTWTRASSNASLTVGVIDAGPDTPVISITTTNQGNGYSNVIPPSVIIASPIQGGGTAATANARVYANGRIDVNLLTSGSGYHIPPKITISPPPGDSNLANVATATAAIRVSPLVGITVTNTGSYYNPVSPPVVTVQRPSYDPVNPSFDIEDSTAQVGSIVNTTGNIAGLYIINGGNNYTTAPYITIASPIAGNTALAESVIQYQISTGNASAWANTHTGNIYLFNKYVPDDELNKYYLFPKVNILK